MWNAKAPIDHKSVWPCLFLLPPSLLCMLCCAIPNRICVSVARFCLFGCRFFYHSFCSIGMDTYVFFFNETKWKLWLIVSARGVCGYVCVCARAREWELIKLVILHLHFATSLLCESIAGRFIVVERKKSDTQTHAKLHILYQILFTYSFSMNKHTLFAKSATAAHKNRFGSKWTGVQEQAIHKWTTIQLNNL